MKTAILVAVVVVGGIFMGKLTIEFLHFLIESLDDEDRHH